MDIDIIITHIDTVEMCRLIFLFINQYITASILVRFGPDPWSSVFYQTLEQELQIVSFFSLYYL